MITWLAVWVPTLIVLVYLVRKQVMGLGLAVIVLGFALTGGLVVSGIVGSLAGYSTDYLTNERQIVYSQDVLQMGANRILYHVVSSDGSIDTRSFERDKINIRRADVEYPTEVIHFKRDKVNTWWVLHMHDDPNKWVIKYPVTILLPERTF